ncbi:hypothetical protein X802_05760 [Thermococcus guaymasensis DSM 11113]|uniref:Uncharacterized protein n=1 Tax=Thermococcus guaymasensis DSM 11113 TaxID=1432656 RepID=A0A0X1KN96_9EURY|nr:hypothetical protein [Thermococcus guaymasensis]AJC72733.1 hypothetical protein X802_05760 [Thermococcus guaymasensis DSM 11113]
MYRGIWLHPWDFTKDAIERMAKIGFNHVSMAVRYFEERQDWPGPNLIFQNPERRTYTSEENAVYWDADEGRYSHLPPYLRPETSTEAKGDIVERFVNACKENSLKSVLWFPTLRWEKAVRANVGVGMKDIYGSHPAYKRMFLCPSNPLVREALELMVEELSERYDFDEFEFDFIRYPEVPSTHGTPLLSLALSPCFCRYCRERARDYGVDLEEVRRELKEVVEWHVDYLSNTPYCTDGDYLQAVYSELARFLLEDDLVRKWIKFRAEVIADLLRDLSKIVRRNNPRAKVTADLYPPSGSWLLGQDYKTISKIVDGVKVMIYTKPFGKSVCRVPYESRLARKLLGKKLLVIGLASWPPMTSEDIEREFRLVLSSPADGVGFYSYGWTPDGNLLTIERLFREVGT